MMGVYEGESGKWREKWISGPAKMRNARAQGK